MQFCKLQKTGGRIQIGVIDSISKNGCGIATRCQKMIDIFTFGLYPKPSYNQLGVYHGDMSGFKKGDIINITYRQQLPFFSKKYWENWKLWFAPNIIKIEHYV